MFEKRGGVDKSVPPGFWKTGFRVKQRCGRWVVTRPLRKIKSYSVTSKKTIKVGTRGQMKVEKREERHELRECMGKKKLKNYNGTNVGHKDVPPKVILIKRLMLLRGGERGGYVSLQNKAHKGRKGVQEGG